MAPCNNIVHLVYALLCIGIVLYIMEHVLHHIVNIVDVSVARRQGHLQCLHPSAIPTVILHPL